MALAAGAVSGCVLCGLALPVLPARWLRPLGLLLLLPAPGLALLLPRLFPEAESWVFPGAREVVRGVLLAPAIMFPTGAAWLAVPPGLGRAAAGLGASRGLTFRLVRLPLLLPAAGLSLLVAIVLIGACRAAGGS